MNEVTYPEWFDALVEECKSIITEATFSSRWALVEGYHQLGSRLLEEEGKEPMDQLVQRVAVSLGKSERMLWYAVKFARMYPQLDSLPEGKNVSWWRIVRMHLTEKNPEPDASSHNLERQVWDVCKDKGCHYKVRVE